MKVIVNADIVFPGSIERGSVTIDGDSILDILIDSDGVKKDFTGYDIIDAKGAYLAPGFIDLHIHGSGGFGTEDMSAESLLKMSLFLAKMGVSAFCPTLYPSNKKTMVENIEKLLPAFGKEEGAEILGFHLEGPFISPQKPGVMKPQDITPVDIKFMKELCAAAQGKIKIMTFAPELEGSSALIDFARQNGVFLQIGHTNATYSQMTDALKKGVSHVTHLFNAMSPFNHREPGAAGAALMGNFSVEIIADGVHVHPAIVNFLSKVKNPKEVFLITDALKPVSQTEGSLFANKEAVSFKDGVFKRVSDNVIAGSALTMMGGVKNLVSFGFSAQNAFMASAYNQAIFLGLKNMGRIEKGFKANLNIIDKEFNLKHSFVNARHYSHEEITS
ncbi:N-Acetylglucosamine-6-phosphate deacetylase [Elusimicrobium minutum Pei191]|uniref:N-Acetylglucosamine-6-phosphate deacetylase n=1 Tax=Elusimicrobium minutum (strain Pei191) TaxID=445932 RepID=B2KEF1_ELUMP|nr:N-acetylglucosamine-6-phosphate deacetylase [Elusimicrobium minutum]ACC98897.1 N-Acetylglucosamine-6-phosphate deacetylase [Elusimicrobium minutum Pei191]